MPKPLTRKDTSASTSDNVCSTPSVSDTILELFQNDTFLKKIHDIVRTIAHEVAETSFAKVNELIERNEGRLHEVEVKVEERKYRLEELEKEIEMKENRILKLEMAANDLQQYSRRSSLRIFGVPEKEKEDTDQIVCDIVSSKLGIPITRNDIDRSHRTGKHTRDTRSKHRSIIAKFCTYRKRTEIIRSRKKLKGSGITIQEDLTHQNAELYTKTYKDPKVKAAWTHDGKIIASIQATGGKIMTKMINSEKDLKSL